VIVGSADLQNGPVFTASAYSGNILEGKPAGTSVLRVSAAGVEVSRLVSVEMIV